MTALDIATQYNQLDIIKKLLNHPAIKVNQALAWYNATPLYIAAEKGYLETVKTLVAHPRININKKSIYARTALSIATQEGHLGDSNAIS